MKGASPTSTYPRIADGFYVEPPWATELLLAKEKFIGSILDPACGVGTIVDVLLAFGYRDVRASDISKRKGFDRLDFLQAPIPIVNNIITNPPFNLAEQFLERALVVTSRKVALLLRLTFLESQSRYDLFRGTPLKRVLVFSNRLGIRPGNKQLKSDSGTAAYAWFVWQHGYKGAPMLGWLRR